MAASALGATILVVALMTGVTEITALRALVRCVDVLMHGRATQTLRAELQARIAITIALRTLTSGLMAVPAIVTFSLAMM